MKKFLIGLGIVFGLLIAAVIALPFLVPASTYRNVIETQLETALGRDVTFGKDPQITVFPQLGVKIADVTIANAEGFNDPHFAKADSMSVAVKWLPLLSKRVEIASASFNGTEVLLEEKANGQANWVFEPKADPKDSEQSESKSASGEPGFDALIPKASLKNSRIRFVSKASDLNYDVTNINLDASLNGLNGPVALNGSLNINDEPFNIDATLTSLANVMKGETFNVDASIGSGLADVSYKGTIASAETVALDGALSATVKSLSKILEFANVDMEQSVDEIGTIKLTAKASGTPENLLINDLIFDQSGKNLTSNFKGSVKIAGSSVQPSGSLTAKSDNVKALAAAFGTELKGATSDAFKTLDASLDLKPVGKGFDIALQKLQFDKISATGTANVNLSTKVPSVSAVLQVPDLDLTPYLVESTGGGQKGDPTDGWSEDPIDLSVLKSANGTLKLAIGRVANDRAEILDVNLNSKIQNGSLSGTLVSKSPDSGRTSKSQKLNPLYDGSLTTDFTLTSVSESMNKLSFAAKGSGIAAADLIKFFTGQNVLKGVAAIDANAKTEGASISDFVKNLSGTYTASVADGAILGVNLAQLLRSAQSALATGKMPSALSPEQQTDFSSLDLKGDIASGTANIELFQMLSPFVRADATGTVDLFNQTLDIRITPQTVQNANAEGEQAGIGGFGIPLRVKGSWSNVSGSLDMDFLSKLVTEQAKTKAKNEIEKKLGGSLDDFLNKSLGGSDKSDAKDSADTSDTTEKKEKSDSEKAKDLLKDLFGNKKE